MASFIITKSAPRQNPAFEIVNAQMHPRLHHRDVILDAQCQSQLALHAAIYERINFCPWHPTYFFKSLEY